MEVSEEIRRTKQRFGIIGDSSALIGAIERALRVAPIDLSVLIIGESGSGKEYFPKIIHENSTRRHKRYIAVNCGAIPEGTIDSELFGHVKGSFTGAIADHKGYFEEADGGTIFLDEVAEMPLSTQARLLRVLESGEFMRVGSSTVQKTNIRVVAATNKDILKAVKDGKFREDLYYRLSTVLIQVPALRERGRDILLLVRKFLRDFAEKNRTPEIELTDDARQALVDYHWPGNVRQLKSVVEQVALFEAGKRVDAATLRPYMPHVEQHGLIAMADGSQFDYNQEREFVFKMIMQLKQEVDALKQKLGTDTPNTRITNSVMELKRESKDLIAYGGMLHSSQHAVKDAQPEDLGQVDEVNIQQVEAEPVKTLDETERETIESALARNRGKRKQTAAELQISERTLYRKIKQYKLEN